MKTHRFSSMKTGAPRHLRVGLAAALTLIITAVTHLSTVVGIAAGVFSGFIIAQVMVAIVRREGLTVMVVEAHAGEGHESGSIEVRFDSYRRDQLFYRWDFSPVAPGAGQVYLGLVPVEPDYIGIPSLTIKATDSGLGAALVELAAEFRSGRTLDDLFDRGFSRSSPSQAAGGRS